MKRWTSMLALLFLATALSAEAQKVELGELKVNFRAEKDVLAVGRDEGPFQKLLLEVEGNDLEVFAVVVTYGIGREDTLEVRHVFREGTRSRVLDLRGNDRFIRKLTFTYKTVGKLREGRATLRVSGLLGD